MKPPFQPGDFVRIVNEGSAESYEKLGQIVQISKISFHKEVKEWYIITEDSLGGIWVNEVRKLTKLERALL